MQYQTKMQKSNNSKSYKDLIKENTKLNKELRRMSLGPNKQDNIANKTPQSVSTTKESYLKNISLRQLQRMKIEQLAQIKRNQNNNPQGMKNKISKFIGKESPSNQNLRRYSLDKNKQYQSTEIPLQNQSPKRIKLQQSKKISILDKYFGYDNQSNININALNLLKNSEYNYLMNQHLYKNNQNSRFQLHTKSLQLQKKYSFLSLKAEQIKKDKQTLKIWVRKNIIGLNSTYISPIGLNNETVYVDHTATNRPFKAVQILVDHAKLFAANPHTEFSKFGKFSTDLMHYARDSLLKSFNAPENQYVVLPTGSGSTGAIEKAVHFLKSLEQSDQTWKNCIVYLTPYQHHSNILPWVEFYNKIQVLSSNQFGTLKMAQIQKQLKQSISNNLIVTVSAASNVTSKLTHLKDLNQVIKRVRQQTNKKIIFSVDCAAFCCHHDLDLLIYNQIDFAFLSPHKNLGGAQSCGVLVARNSLMNRAKPTFPGGGTVKFVKGYSKNDVMYEGDVFAKQIAGTPPFLGFYRAALSFQLLKNVIGYNFIHENQKRNTQLFFKLINDANQQLKQQGIDMHINIYGEKNFDERANVISFNFEYGENNFIQHSFSSLILTSVYGIQVRSGCFCAGPYGIQLLQINQNIIDKIGEQVQAGILINKPGYIRLDLTFYLEEFEVQYIAKSIILIARYWKNLLKLYTVCNHGEVLLLPIFNKFDIPQIYSLSEIEKAQQKLKQQEESHSNKLQKRKETLERQLKMGEYISKNPVDFIRKVKNGQKFEPQN